MNKLPYLEPRLTSYYNVAYCHLQQMKSIIITEQEKRLTALGIGFQTGQPKDKPRTMLEEPGHCMDF